MTKIKNTKKGMAKKTLSMSLVVAMLATSNVPVWAAEFSDGSDDVAVATEAPVAEAFSDETDAPVVEDATNTTAATETVKNDSYNVTPTFSSNVAANNSVAWNAGNITASFKVTAKDGSTSLPSGATLNYAWKVDGIASTEYTCDFNSDVTTVNAPVDQNTAGKTLTLYIYVKANDGTTPWDYTSDAIQVKAVTDPALANITTSYNPTYNGKEQVITADQISWGTGVSSSDYDIAVSGDTKNVTNDGVTVTITTKKTGYTGSKTLKYQIQPLTLNGTTTKDAEGNVTLDQTISGHFEATLKTTNFTYTGKVIRVKASDVTLIDKDTKEDLSAYLKADEKGYVSLKAISAQDAGETPLRLNLIEGQPESGSKNYSIAASTDKKTDADGYRTIETSNKATIAVRDLSTVDISIKAKSIPTAGTAVSLTKDDVTFTDKTSKETLDLFNQVDLTIPKTATAKGSYEVTVEPKTAVDNVSGKTTATLNLVAADISAATFSGKEATTAEEYTGAAVTKTEKQLGSLVLNGKAIDKSEYTIEYANNTNAGTAKIIVKGKGSFEGSEAVFEFTINPAKVTASDVAVEKKVEYIDTQNAADYKDAVKLVVKAKNGNKKEFTLVNGTDYTVKYSFNTENTIDTGYVKATVTITNKNFLGAGSTFEKESQIKARAIKSENIKLKENSFTYTGSAITPDFDVVIDGKIVNPNLYTATFTNNVNAGTATLTVTGKDVADSTAVDKVTKYSDIPAKLTFEIKPADASNLVGVIASEAYRGYSIEIPADGINLKLGNNVIDVASNFKLSYGENLNIGHGTVTLTPKNGNFTGTKTVTFDIVGKLVNEDNVTADIKGYDANGIEKTDGFKYDGTAHTYDKVIASISYTENGKTTKLVEGKDYDLVYVDNVYGKNVSGTQKGAVLAIAKGTYGGSLTTSDKSVVKGIYTDAEGNKTANVIAIKTFEITPVKVNASSVVIKNAVYAGGLSVKPNVTIVVNGVTLVEGKDYTLNLSGSEDLVNATTGKTNKVSISFKNGYVAGGTAVTAPKDWGIDKFDLANADVTVEDGKVTVKCGRVDVETSEYTVEQKDGKVTVTAKKDSKNYTGSKTVDAVTEDQKPGTPMISNVKVVGNKATAILSGEADGAAGYDYVISTDRDCITNKDYTSVNKNQVQTSTTFKYVQQGTYYAYCHAWKRDENGKKVFSDWSNAYPFVVSAITPDAPVITNVTVSGSTIKVTYKAAANATGYDVVLGTDSKKENGETRPYHYGNHKVLNLKEGTVTATFKKVPKGTWVVGMHAFNRTSEDGKKVFSPWSNLKKATVR